MLASAPAGRLPLRRALPVLLLIAGGGAYFTLRSRAVHAPVTASTAERLRGSAGKAAEPPPSSASTLASVRTLLQGRVQTERGAALEGARVCVSQPDAACCEAASCTLSGSDGRFELEHRGARAIVVAARSGYLPLRQVLQGPLGAAPVLLTMQAGGARVTGVVVDATGGPVAGAWLSALDAQDQPLAIGVSDAAGGFGLDVTPGVLRVSARADGYSEQLQKVRAPAVGLRLALTPAASIVGRTLSEAGAPMADVRVIALGQDGLRAAPLEAHSSADGTFRLNGLPAGRYALLALSEHWRSDERSVHVGVAQTSEPVDLLLRAATSLTAIVNVAGAPCERGSVSLSGAGGGYLPLEQGGRAVFGSLSPGRYQVSVDCEAGLGQSASLDLGLEPVTRVWELEQGLRVTGVALTPAGAPVAGAPIEVDPVDEPFGRARVHCLSDERGEFSCAGLVPGEYACTIGDSVPLRGDSVRVTVAEGSVPRVVLRTHPEAAIRVRIQDAQQFELPSLPLVARGKAGALLGELEGDEFVFQPLALGRYEIASEPSPQGTGTIVELTREGQIAELTLTLPAAHTLSGRVTADDGQAVPDAWVRAVLASRDARVRPVTPVLTDGEGAFSLTGLLPGRYRLMVSSGQGEAQLDELPSDSRNVVVRLPSYGSLALSLRSAEGSPVAGFLVAYRRAGDDSGNEAPGSRGAWSIPWAPPGRYELTARAAEGSATTMVELPPGGEVSVALQLEPRPR